MTIIELLTNPKRWFSSGLGTLILLVMMIAMIILPLPAFLLDILFTFNISFALIVLLAGVYANRPLDFAVFPSILLIATLLRLALNIASTRVVLLNGHTGNQAAGKVIESFGEVVVGGNYAVGFAIFIILIIINFVVVTKGAGRISEVSARFTLDAMPGKQMGIDADLNAGIITQEEAKTRRDEVAKESDFYGAMDGASKFVRGDAIAGILILLINLIGGVAIGTLQQEMDFSQAVQNYGLLTIGDGLVAQIPSLVLSTAAALMVTRVSTIQDMGNQVANEMFGDPKVLALTALVIGGFGLIPGMPHFVFLLLGASCGAGAYYVYYQKNKKELMPVEEVVEEALPTKEKELGWDDVRPVDLLSIEIGYRLIPLVDEAQGGELLSRIKGVRKKVSQELGFLVPSVHIRDNLKLGPNAYRVSMMGVNCGEADVFLDKELAINPGQVVNTIEGIATKDPAFDLDAVWIDPSLKDQAQTMGYTVVNISTVIATHLSHILEKNSSKLLGHEEVAHLLDRLEQTRPKLAASIEELPISSIVRVLQNCLEESVPIRDFRTIAESLAEAVGKNQDPDYLTNKVRAAVSGLMLQEINGNYPEVPVITFSPELERILQKSLQTAEGGGIIEPSLAEKISSSMKAIVDKQEAIGEPAVLLVPAAIRSLLSRFLRVSMNSLNVLSYHEIPDDKQIKIVATIGQ